MLNVHGIINYVDSNNERFVEYIRDALGERVQLLINVMNQNYAEVSDTGLDALLKEFLSIISQIIQDKDYGVACRHTENFQRTRVAFST